ncbi:substrate binding domain-containing protein [Leptolyngbya sp. FACHB-261]|uniref:substrate binding domain-containing protein n=1 Tax=Leptolyngbya sp. FACHB-261 TaxID=2692806 RepID=UPI001F559558|nr:substrate binding domain-containing protein [Leptolyngbya sp. FACHB-261]
MAEAEASVGRRQKPSGLLRLSCPVSFGQFQVVPRLKLFLDRYPDIKIDLLMSDQFTDLVEEGVDLAIRIGNLQDSSLVVHRIGTARRLTVATPAYFETNSEPQVPQDLIQHNCIVYTRLSTGQEWHFEGPEGLIKVRVDGNLRANNSAAVREAVLSGLGIAVSPVWLFSDALRQGKLSVVLKEYQPTPLPIHTIYRKNRFLSAKVRCLVDFLIDEFGTASWIPDIGNH